MTKDSSKPVHFSEQILLSSRVTEAQRKINIGVSVAKHLMIKNQRLYTQRNDASIHEWGANVNVITFGQANLINDQ